MKKIAFVKHLRRRGCQLIRQGKKHEFWAGPTGSRATAPRHTELQNPLVKAICQQLQVKLPNELE
ncbi:MAG: type II toxin-antitoxin system HicA family toxin [Fimbriiglobus sp.]